MVKCKINHSEIVKIRFFIDFVHLLEKYGHVTKITKSKSNDWDYDIIFLPVLEEE